MKSFAEDRTESLETWKSLYIKAQAQLLEEAKNDFIEFNLRHPDYLDEARIIDQITPDKIKQRAEQLFRQNL